MTHSTISSNAHTADPVHIALDQITRTAQQTKMTDLFAHDAHRFDALHVTCDGLTLDYSKTHLTPAIINALLAWARARNVEQQRDAMFAGTPINTSENRPVLHTALRRPPNDTVMVDGHNIMPDIHNTLVQMKIASNDIRNGVWTGTTGMRITDVINIGIGGQDLGVAMATAALQHSATTPGPRLHFTGNVDGHALAPLLATLHPLSTLVIVSSKTMTTTETLMNAKAARAWLNAAGADPARHMVMISANTDAPHILDLPKENLFPFGLWVGGRFSVWSSAGFGLALAIGFDGFAEFLRGAHALDMHFQTAPLDRNIPVLMALTHAWYASFWDLPARAVIPYDQRLARLAAFLQQLEMESNGKPAALKTATIVYGEPGTSAQHSFFQHLHQGTAIVPVDFIAVANADHDLPDHHRVLLANALAQAQALMTGKPDGTYPGDRPSLFLMLDRLTPYTLGMLLATYEHKVMVEGCLWGLNSFDQPGVALGKTVADRLLQNWDSLDDGDFDSSTRGLRRLLGSGL